MTAADLNAAIRQASDAINAWDRAKRDFERQRRAQGLPFASFHQTGESDALRAAASVSVGRVTVTADIGGNSVARHVRVTFKIDGKRASRADVFALAA